MGPRFSEKEKDELTQKISKLRSEGITTSEISSKLGISNSTVYRLIENPNISPVLIEKNEKIKTAKFLFSQGRTEREVSQEIDLPITTVKYWFGRFKEGKNVRAIKYPSKNKPKEMEINFDGEKESLIRENKELKRKLLLIKYPENESQMENILISLAEKSLSEEDRKLILDIAAKYLI